MTTRKKNLTIDDMTAIAARHVEAMGGQAAAYRHYGVSKMTMYRALRGLAGYHRLLEQIVSDATGRTPEHVDMWRV